jgi:hypothetical protein
MTTDEMKFTRLQLENTSPSLINYLICRSNLYGDTPLQWICCVVSQNNGASADAQFRKQVGQVFD